MRINIISIVGILVVFYLIIAGLSDYGNRSLKTTGVILEVGNSFEANTSKGIKKIQLPLKVKYNLTPQQPGNEYIQDSIFTFNINDDISKYAVGESIDIYLDKQDYKFFTKTPLNDNSSLFIPLSYILLIGVCYYTFKN